MGRVLKGGRIAVALIPGVGSQESGFRSQGDRQRFGGQLLAVKTLQYAASPASAADAARDTFRPSHYPLRALTNGPPAVRVTLPLLPLTPRLFSAVAEHWGFLPFGLTLCRPKSCTIRMFTDSS